MAELNSGGGSHHGGKHDKKRAKKQSTRVDMTPMVDLAFLLLTFFVLTSTFSKPKVLRMIFPEKLDKNNPDVKAPEVRNGITLLLSGDDKLYYYTGALDEKAQLETIDYTKNGLRKVLAERNLKLINKLKELQGRMEKINEADTAAKNKVDREVKAAQAASDLVVLVKADEKATYKNMIDVIDEFMITQIAKYFVVDEGMAPMEKELIKKQGK
ncbi:MAG: biopolymer transporter ExbD [Bacteroidetes bacterium]|nr:biopolymer transporter ExbD [Bacteroidota bacterium]